MAEPTKVCAACESAAKVCVSALMPGIDMAAEFEPKWARDARGLLQDAADAIRAACTHAPAAAPSDEPEPMVILCPECKAQHIDLGEWATSPHRKHLCHSCGHVWKPHDHATVGVPIPAAAPRAVAALANDAISSASMAAASDADGTGSRVEPVAPSDVEVAALVAEHGGVRDGGCLRCFRVGYTTSWSEKCPIQRLAAALAAMAAECETWRTRYERQCAGVMSREQTLVSVRAECDAMRRGAVAARETLQSVLGVEVDNAGANILPEIRRLRAECESLRDAARLEALRQRVEADAREGADGPGRPLP